MQTVLGKYEIRSTIATGPMGTVYDGWDKAIERRVAIKAVPFAQAGDADGPHHLIRFKREAQAAGRLQHPAVVGIFDYGETGDHAFIVMEYVDGGSLKSALDSGRRFSLADIDAVMQDILAGLQYCHLQGVTHRDIKPANIMLTKEGRAKVADFGIARIEHSDITQVGTVMGTPAYMSPEQFRGEAVTARTDIYSAGVILYQMLTGERPFEGGLATIMHKALSVVPPKPSSLSNLVPHAVDVVVARAMAKQPKDRFESALSFAQALHLALVAKATKPAKPATVPPVARLAGTWTASMPASRHRIAAAACAAALLAVGGLLVYGRTTPAPVEQRAARPEQPTSSLAALPPAQEVPQAPTGPSTPSVKPPLEMDAAARPVAPIEQAIIVPPATSGRAAPVSLPAPVPVAPPTPLPLTVTPSEPSKPPPPARPVVAMPSVPNPAADIPKPAMPPVAGVPSAPGTTPTPALPPVVSWPVWSGGAAKPPVTTPAPAQLPAARREERVPAPRPLVRPPATTTEAGKTPLPQGTPQAAGNPTPAGNRKPQGDAPVEAENRVERSPPPQFLAPKETVPAERRLFGTFIVIDGRRVLVPSEGTDATR